MLFNDKLYNVLKWITLVALPAMGTLYFTLAQIWSLPLGEEIVGTIAAVTTFLGILLGISTASYNKQGKQNASYDEDAPHDEE